MASQESTFILCYDTNTLNGIEQTVENAFQKGFQYVALPLVDPIKDTKSIIECKSSNDDILQDIPFIYSGDISSQIFSCVFGKISPWITFEQSNTRLPATTEDNNDNGKLDQFFAKTAENACIGASNELLLQHELNWASHLGINSLLLPQPNNSNNNVKYASAIISGFKDRTFSLGIIPILGNKEGWQCWKILSKLITSVCKCIVPCIILLDDIPCMELQNQWFAEGVQYFILNCDIFLTNVKNYPILSKGHQSILRRHMRVLNTTVILQNNSHTDSHHSTLEDTSNIVYYSQYLQHLRNTVLKLSENECYEKSYWDVLQTPLQPLSDNLDYSTYETFESDPVKYIKYEEAIVQALEDWNNKLNITKNLIKQPFATVETVETTKSGSIESETENKTQDITTTTTTKRKVVSPRQDPAAIIVMILGAGRGPLVDCALNASNKTGIPVKIYAIEKNPHAIVILKNKQKYSWKTQVEVINKDMREWRIENESDKAHIIVSELLGSFGDNELSPECLDGALYNSNSVDGRGLLRRDGISIPTSYTSYIAPITYYSVWRRLKESPRDFETPHVVHLINFSPLDENKPCWKFEHTCDNNDNNSESVGGQVKHNANNTHNARYVEIEFEMNKDSVCHGFAGYFETVLYKDVMLSIRPENYSKGMFSWFPMYFPLTNPIFVKNGMKLVAHFWRKVSTKGVWYEWCTSEPMVSNIHNPCHRSSIVQLH